LSNHLRDSLVKDLRDGSVLIVAGTGVSAAATGNAPTSTWKGLLKDGLERCCALDPSLDGAWQSRVSAEIDSEDLEDLLSAAEKISTKLNAPLSGEWSRWLRESIGELPSESKELPLAIAALGTPIATTNYDTLLDDVVGGTAATWNSPNRIQRIVRGQEKSVAHLHGVWHEPSSVILGIRSYEGLLGNAPAQGLQRAFSILQSILFVGMGAGTDDPNWSTLIKYLSVAAPELENRHYRLCLNSEVKQLSSNGQGSIIHPIGYGDEHDELAPFLRELAVEAGRISLSDSQTQTSIGLLSQTAEVAVVARVAIGLILHEGSIVLVQRRISEGALEWQFPAGFVKPLRDPAHSIREEVIAETGLTCRVGDRMGERIHPETKMTCVYFQLHLLHGDLTNGDSTENLEVRWVPVDRVFEYIDESQVFPAFASVIQDQMRTTR
jgi:ADP-ribose pyrophosphatase YjhB (NUDIX family)